MDSSTIAHIKDTSLGSRVTERGFREYTNGTAKIIQYARVQGLAIHLMPSYNPVSMPCMYNANPAPQRSMFYVP